MERSHDTSWFKVNTYNCLLHLNKWDGGDISSSYKSRFQSSTSSIFRDTGLSSVLAGYVNSTERKYALYCCRNGIWNNSGSSGIILYPSSAPAYPDHLEYISPYEIGHTTTATTMSSFCTAHNMEQLDTCTHAFMLRCSAQVFTTVMDHAL